MILFGDERYDVKSDTKASDGGIKAWIALKYAWKFLLINTNPRIANRDGVSVQNKMDFSPDFIVFDGVG